MTLNSKISAYSIQEILFITCTPLAERQSSTAIIVREENKHLTKLPLPWTKSKNHSTLKVYGRPTFFWQSPECCKRHSTSHFSQVLHYVRSQEIRFCRERKSHTHFYFSVLALILLRKHYGYGFCVSENPELFVPVLVWICSFICR